jgi:hypothetical protein
MYKRVNKDDLRSMLDMGRRSKINEKVVLETRDNIIETSLENWFSVIVDDTNLDPKHERDLKLLAAKHGADFRVEQFNTPIQECIRRDLLRENPVGEKVIRDMQHRYIARDNWFDYYPVNTELLDCIIVDIDWTLAQKWDRDIYDWSKVGLDTVIFPVGSIVNAYFQAGFYDWEEVKIFIMSWRDSKYRKETELWLLKNHIPFDDLYMRPEWDNRDDVIIKTELREENIKDKYNVLFAIDDRRKVVDNRRELWIYTLDCNQQRSVF